MSGSELSSQMRRSARSVCANVAEGSERNSDPDFAQFVEIAYGSAMEVASDAILAADEGYLTSDEADAILAQVAVVTSLASGLYARLTAKTPSGIPRSAFRIPPRSEAT